MTEPLDASNSRRRGLRIVAADGAATHEAESRTPAAPVRRRSVDWLLVAALVAYALLLAAAWVALRYAADYRWWATVLLFGPRWIWVVPLPILALVVLIVRRRLAYVLGLLGLSAVALGLAGPHVPWRLLIANETGDRVLRVLTCNCDDRLLRVDELNRVILETDPDIVALQDAPPGALAALFAGGLWHIDVASPLTLASRYPIRAREYCNDPAFDQFSGAMCRYELDVDGTLVNFVNVHMATPRWALLAVRWRGWNGAEQLQANSDKRHAQIALIRRLINDRRNVIVAGDLNTPPESPLFRILTDHLSSAFVAAGWGTGNTFMANGVGLHLDQVLYDRAWRARECQVGPNVGAQHRPVFVVLASTTSVAD